MPAASGSAQPSSTLRVGLVEWGIVTSAPSLLAGSDQLAVTNAGTTPHDLHISGVGVRIHSPLLVPGAKTTVTIRTLAATVLTLTCDVPGHEAAGMHSTISVRPN
jgi:hypothetical protein